MTPITKFADPDPAKNLLNVAIPVMWLSVLF
jgi:hypothetical protein